MTKAQLWVIAGPNGAGKSTLISQRFQGRLPFVNPDDIARQLAPTDFDNPRIVIQAGRQAVAERRAHLLARRSFAIETTLTGNSSLDLIHQAITSDYKINLVFIGLDDVALSMARVASRVLAGGHNVPLPRISCEGSLAAWRTCARPHRTWIGSGFWTTRAKDGGWCCPANKVSPDSCLTRSRSGFPPIFWTACGAIAHPHERGVSPRIKAALKSPPLKSTPAGSVTTACRSPRRRPR